MHQVVSDRINENIASLVQSGMYRAINTDETKTNELYAIQFISDAYTLKNDTTIDGQVISAGKLVVKAQYLSQCNKIPIGIENNNHFNIPL